MSVISNSIGIDTTISQTDLSICPVINYFGQGNTFISPARGNYRRRTDFNRTYKIGNTEFIKPMKNSFEQGLNDNFLQMSNPHYRGEKLTKLQNIGAGCRSQNYTLSGLHQRLTDCHLLLRHKYLYDNHRRKMYYLFQLSQSRPLSQTKSHLILDKKYMEKIFQIGQWANFE